MREQSLSKHTQAHTHTHIQVCEALLTASKCANSLHPCMHGHSHRHARAHTHTHTQTASQLPNACVVFIYANMLTHTYAKVTYGGRLNARVAFTRTRMHSHIYARKRPPWRNECLRSLREYTQVPAGRNSHTA